MLTADELLQEIENCQREPITEKKIDRLAHCITIYDHLFGRTAEPIIYSTSSRLTEKAIEIETDGSTEFLEAINGKSWSDVAPAITELVECVQVMHPKMYEAFIGKL